MELSAKDGLYWKSITATLPDEHGSIWLLISDTHGKQWIVKTIIKQALNQKNPDDWSINLLQRWEVKYRAVYRLAQTKGYIWVLSQSHLSGISKKKQETDWS